jgi:hypothetical protein
MLLGCRVGAAFFSPAQRDLLTKGINGEPGGTNGEPTMSSILAGPATVLTDHSLVDTSVDERLRILDEAILRRCEWATSLHERGVDPNVIDLDRSIAAYPAGVPDGKNCMATNRPFRPVRSSDASRPMA